MAQTPQQKRANERFAKKEAQKMGTYRAKADRETRDKMKLSDKFQKPTISRGWIYLFLFILLGGIFIELLSYFFKTR